MHLPDPQEREKDAEKEAAVLELLGKLEGMYSAHGSPGPFFLVRTPTLTLTLTLTLNLYQFCVIISRNN